MKILDGLFSFVIVVATLGLFGISVPLVIKTFIQPDDTALQIQYFLADRGIALGIGYV